MGFNETRSTRPVKTTVSSLHIMFCVYMRVDSLYTQRHRGATHATRHTHFSPSHSTRSVHALRHSLHVKSTWSQALTRENPARRGHRSAPQGAAQGFYTPIVTGVSTLFLK